MASLKDAKIILKILKDNNHEAYIVGGAVRDHLLKIKSNDIDITTSAKPYQVSKLFKSVPTGEKYGTVTIFFKNEPYEVTTYRLDGPSFNHRHPDNVKYSNSVMDDISRRDFTINGLLMDENLEIYDYVEGMKDLENKIIKTIGDPNNRFKEDALRMLRAFYFESKLGFDLDDETKNAIKENKDLILNISKERILNEIIKILKEENIKKSFNSMVETTITNNLYGLKEAIELVATSEDDAPFIDVFFALAVTLNNQVLNNFPFSNKHKHKYRQSAYIANNIKIYDNLVLYEYGLDYVLLANKVNYLLKKEPYLKSKLTKTYEELPLKSEMDLKMRSDQIIELLNKKPGAWLGDLKRELAHKILTNEIDNDYDVIKQYVINEGKRNKWI